jgi:uncharacterized protein YndB with AHSA1/START domain
MTMNSQTYTATIDVAKPPDHVFECIIDVSKWWGGKELEGSTRLLNDEFTIKHGDVHYSKQRMIEVVPGRRVVWLITESRLAWLENKHEWTDTRLVFEIAPRGEGAVLHFTHQGLVPERECHATCSEGWNLVIKDYLFNFIAEGRVAAQLYA